MKSLIDFIIKNANEIEHYEIEEFEDESEINFFMENGNIETFYVVG